MCRYRRAADGKKIIQRKREYNEWLACIPNAHPGYSSWERFQENLKVLEINGHPYEVARGSPPREGRRYCKDEPSAVVADETSAFDYVTRRGGQEAWYVCDRGHSTNGEPNCQSIAAKPIDRALGTVVTESMTPTAVELALEIHERSRLGTKRPISFAAAPLNVLRSKRISRSADLCWSIRYVTSTKMWRRA
jgi:hypothetical protein